MFDTPFTARFSLDKVEAIEVLMKDFKFASYTSMRMSTDREGTNVVSNVMNGSDSNQTVYSNEFFVKYPFKEDILLGTGDEEYGSLAKTGSSYRYNIQVPLPTRKDIVDVKVQRWFTAILDGDGNVWHTGRMRGYDSKQEFVKLSLPAKVKTWAVGKYTIIV